MKYWVILSLLCTGAWADKRQTATAAQVVIAQRLSAHVLSIQDANSPQSYGTAWIWEKLQDDLYFILIPLHALPKNPTDVNSLQSFWGPTRKKHFPTRVVATAPGFDLALGVIDVGEMDPQFRKAFDVWTQDLPKKTTLADSNMRAAVVGVPNFWVDRSWDIPAILFRGLDPAESVTSGPGEAGVRPFHGQSVAIGEPEFSKSTAFEKLSHCPQAFARTCYRMELEPGFSGGMIMVAPLGKGSVAAEEAKILGMVTHFSPWRSEGYILPAHEVLRVGELMRKEYLRLGNGAVWKWDKNTPEDSYYEVAFNQILILKGDLKGELIASKGLNLVGAGGDVSGGGGDVSGGGGDFSGAGGDVSGGGGDVSGGGGDVSNGGGSIVDGTAEVQPQRWYVDPHGNISGLMDEEALIKAISEPKYWHLPDNLFSRLLSLGWQNRGALAVLAYEPGVRLQKKDVTVFGNSPVINLPHFLSLYEANGGKFLKPNLKPIALPDSIEVGGPQNKGVVGVLSLSTLAKMRGREFYEGLAVSKEVANLSQLEIVLLKARYADLGKFRNTKHGVFSSRTTMERVVNIGWAQWKRKGDSFVITLDGDGLEMEFKNTPEHLGMNTYRFTPKLAENAGAFMLVQILPEENRMEVKIVGVSGIEKDAPLDKELTREGFNFDTVAVTFPWKK